MESRFTILLIGGYGKVGSLITRFLSHSQEFNLLIGGRDQKKATLLAQQLSENVKGVAFDIHRIGVNEMHILQMVQAVVVCVDQVRCDFAYLCSSLSLIYIDISANTDLMINLLKSAHVPKAGSGLLVTCVGLCPGLSNLLAKELLCRYPHAQTIHIGLLLGLGEKHGKAAIEWTIKNYAEDFSYQGKWIESFIEKEEFYFPEPIGKRKAYRFNFSDQHCLKTIYPGYEFTTSLCFDSTRTTHLLHWIKKTGLANLLKIKWVNKACTYLLDTLSFGSESYALVVKATREQHILGTIALSGQKEAIITAQIAASCIKHIMEHCRHLCGVYDIVQILSIEDILPHIKPTLTCYESK